MAIYFDSYSFKFGDYGSNNGTIFDIKIGGDSTDYYSRWYGPTNRFGSIGLVRSYDNLSESSPNPDLINLYPGSYSGYVYDSTYPAMSAMTVVYIRERERLLLDAEISDSSCLSDPNQTCSITVNDFNHDVNNFVYNLYVNGSDLPIDTYEGYKGDELHTFTGLESGNKYTVEAYEKDEIVYIYKNITDCTEGDVDLENGTDPVNIVNNWDNFSLFSEKYIKVFFNGNNYYFNSGLNNDGSIDSDNPDNWFYTGDSSNSTVWPLNTGVRLNMYVGSYSFSELGYNGELREGLDVGPNIVSNTINPERINISTDNYNTLRYSNHFYYNTDLNKFLIFYPTYAIPGTFEYYHNWCTFNPTEDYGNKGNPTTTDAMASGIQWVCKPINIDGRNATVKFDTTNFNVIMDDSSVLSINTVADTYINGGLDGIIITGVTILDTSFTGTINGLNVSGVIKSGNTITSTNLIDESATYVAGNNNKLGIGDITATTNNLIVNCYMPDGSVLNGVTGADINSMTGKYFEGTSNTEYTVNSDNTIINAETKGIKNTVIGLFNTNIFGGFVSGCGYSEYEHEITLGSYQATSYNTDNLQTNSYSDNDYIGIILAYFRDEEGLYGPKDGVHSIFMTLSRTASIYQGTKNGVTIHHNLGTSAYGFTGTTIGYTGNTSTTNTGTGLASNITTILYSTTTPWGSSTNDWLDGNNIRIKIKREHKNSDNNGERFTIKFTDNFNVNTINTVSYNENYTITFDLDDHLTWLNKGTNILNHPDEPDALKKFYGPQKYGYYSFSQPNVEFFDITFSGTQTNTRPTSQTLEPAAIEYYTTPMIPYESDCEYIETVCSDTFKSNSGDSDGKVYIDAVDSSNNASMTFDLSSNVIASPCPSITATVCGCPCEVCDQSIKIDIKKKK